jgi:hypothetical protein
MMPSVTVAHACQIQGQQMPVSVPPSVQPDRAEELCDQLMEHTFECDSCINGAEESCEIFCKLREEIAGLGGPKRGLGLTM